MCRKEKLITARLDLFYSKSFYSIVTQIITRIHKYVYYSSLNKFYKLYSNICQIYDVFLLVTTLSRQSMIALNEVITNPYTLTHGGFCSLNFAANFITAI